VLHIQNSSQPHGSGGVSLLSWQACQSHLEGILSFSPFPFFDQYENIFRINLVNCKFLISTKPQRL
jgi:hypothetical protein